MFSRLLHGSRNGPRRKASLPFAFVLGTAQTPPGITPGGVFAFRVVPAPPRPRAATRGALRGPGDTDCRRDAPDCRFRALLVRYDPLPLPVYFLLFYEADDEYATKRAPHRPAHLDLVRAAHARGELVQAGALADPVDGSVLVFRGDSPDVAIAFARQDPFVTEGIVKRWYVRQWTTVVGPDATVPTIGV
jgi:uncharacterized protein YciI